MPVPSLESVLVLRLFQCLLAGFVFVVLCVALWRGLGQHDSAPRFRPLAASFFALSGYLLADVLDAYFEISYPGTLHFQGLHATAQCLETIAILFLIPAYGPRHWLGFLVILAPWSPLLGNNELTLMNLALLAGVGLLYIADRHRTGWFAISPVASGLAAMISRLLQQEWFTSGRLHSLLWGAENVLALGSLMLFALVVEKRAQNLHIQIFVRLNLIFILVANSLVVVSTQIERRELLEFEERRLQDLAEFLRGHVLHFQRQGWTSEEILASQEITKRIVSDFGKFPDLRQVRLFLERHWMEMSIGGDGSVDYILNGDVDATPRADPTVRIRAGERITTLLTLPIFRDQRLVGRVELDESLHTIDAAMRRQLRTIVVSFTLLVLFSCMLIGLTVRDANRTIRRQYEEIERTHRQLLEAAKLASVGELAGGVAHEINNPAGIILARADYMADLIKRPTEPQELAEDLDVIRRQAGRISEIVRGLLAFSRPSRLETRRVDWNELTEESLSLITPRCRQLGVSLRRSYHRDLPPVDADPDGLEQVFVNILNNALDAMAEGGELAVVTGLRDPRRLFAAFSDSGTGITEEHLPRIFDPFFTTKPPGQGTGLGLAISYGIVRDHGGEIQVESAAGRGSTFTVLIPIAEGQ